MSMAALLPIILTYGLPVAEKLWALITSNVAVTQNDWDNLKAFGATTRKQDMIASLLRNGIDPTSAQGQALLALVA